MEEGTKKLHAQLEQAQQAVEALSKESFEDRMARQRAYLDAVHNTASGPPKSKREQLVDWMYESVNYPWSSWWRGRKENSLQRLEAEIKSLEGVISMEAVVEAAAMQEQAEQG